MSNIVPLSDMDRMAAAAVQSRMFGFKTKDEALAIMLLCQAEGLHPGIAMRDYHVIQGRPTLKADAMLARFQQAGGSVKWETLTDQEVSGTSISHTRRAGAPPSPGHLPRPKKSALPEKTTGRNTPAPCCGRAWCPRVSGPFIPALWWAYTPLKKRATWSRAAGCPMLLSRSLRCMTAKCMRLRRADTR